MATFLQEALKMCDLQQHKKFYAIQYLLRQELSYLCGIESKINSLACWTFYKIIRGIKHEGH